MCLAIPLLSPARWSLLERTLFAKAPFQTQGRRGLSTCKQGWYEKGLKEGGWVLKQEFQAVANISSFPILREQYTTVTRITQTYKNNKSCFTAPLVAFKT